MQALCTVPPAELPNNVSCFLACFRRRAHVDQSCEPSLKKSQGVPAIKPAVPASRQAHTLLYGPLAVITEAEAPVMPFRQRLLNTQDIHVML